MKGNTKISAIAFAAALGTLMVTSQGAYAGPFSPVMPGNDVQVDLGVLDQLDDRDASQRNLSSPNSSAQRIQIDSQLLIYPRTTPKSRFLAPQLLLTPPAGTTRIDTSNAPRNSSLDDIETVVIDGAGLVPSANDAPQQPALKLHQPEDRITLRPPVSFPARPAVERIETAPVSRSFSSTGNLGGSINNADLNDDGATQIIHLVQPTPHNVDGLPRTRPAQPAAAPASAPLAAPAATPVTNAQPASLLVPAGTNNAAPAAPVNAPARVMQVADNAPAVAVPAAPKVSEPKIDTPREAPKNKMPVPEVKTAPLPDAQKPAAKQPAAGPSTTPVPLKKENEVKSPPSPAPDTTTSPQEMLDKQSGNMPKPPAPKQTAQKAEPKPVAKPEVKPEAKPEPRTKPQVAPRETASAPASMPAEKPASAPAGGDYSLPFAENSFELDPSAQKSLDKVIGTLARNGDLRVQLQAYAAGESQNASKARRLSLSRALQVRSYLIDGGVRSTRIDVRALGANVPSGPADRVDVKTVQR